MAQGIEQPLLEKVKMGRGNGRFRVIWAITRKDMSEIVRNSQLMVMGVMPIVIFLLYRLMVSGISESSILDIAVYDLGSSQLVAAMQQNPALNLHLVSNEAALHEQINKDEMSGLLIPANFDEAVAAGEKPELTIWLNPQRGLNSETIQWQRFLETEMMKLGQQSLPVQIEWVSVDADNPFGNDAFLDSYLLVVVLTMVLFMIGVNVMAMLIAEEKDRKTAVMLTTSPAQINDIVWGKVVAGIIFIIAVAAIVILINGGLTGNWPLALVYMVLSLPASASAGVLVGSFTQSVKQCNSWLSLVMIIFLIPAWFLTLIKLPEPFNTLINAIPSRYVVNGLNDALNGTAVSAQNTSNLTAWTLFMLLLVVTAVWRVHAKPQSIIA